MTTASLKTLYAWAHFIYIGRPKQTTFRIIQFDFMSQCDILLLGNLNFAELYFKNEEFNTQCFCKYIWI